MGCTIICHSQALTELLVFLQRTTEESFHTRMELEAHLRENAEGFPGNYYYHNALAGPSSFLSLVTSRPSESNAASFLPPEDAGSDPTSMVECGSHGSTSNRPGIVGPESVLAHDPNHFQGNHVAQPAQFPGNSWSNMHFNSCDNSTCWNQALNSPYVHANMNGPYVEAGNIGVQGYQMTATNRSSTGFLHSSMAQGHPHLHHPPPPVLGVRRYNNNFLSQVATSSHRTLTISSSNTSVSALQCVVVKKNDDTTDYEDQENIGILDCGHECHGDCIKKWLLMRNTCPICKSTALIIEGKDM